METSGFSRLLIGAVSIVLLVGYVAWRWRRAGHALEAQAAYGHNMTAYFAAMTHDPRWLRLLSWVHSRYPLAAAGATPEAFVVRQIALVDDFGRMYAQHSQSATRVVVLLVRSQPSTPLYVSMDLANGNVREDPAPHGWTYQGPLR